MIDVIVAMKTDLEMLKTAFAGAMKVGPVEEVDAEKGYRLNLGEGSDGAPFLSPFYPHPESGGQSSSWMPLSRGQIVGVLNPNGDPNQGVLFRGGFSGENGPPSGDLLANVLQAFGITVTMKDGKVTIDGDLTLTGDLRVEGVADFEGDHVKHRGASIDDGHIHGGVIPGPSNTDVPAN